MNLLYYKKTYLSCKKCGFILDCDFTKDSLYKSLARTNQTKVVRVQRIVEVDEATNEDAENLEIAMGKPIQSFTTTGFNVFGEVIEFCSGKIPGRQKSIRSISKYLIHME